MSIATYRLVHPPNNTASIASHTKPIKLLSSVEEEKVLMKVYIKNKVILISSIVLDVDTENNTLILDDCPLHGSDSLSGIEAATFEIVLGKARILFSTDQVSSCQHANRQALRLQLPETLGQIQRRGSYRIDVPVSDPIICVLPVRSGAQTASLNVKDVSTGGLALLDSERILGDAIGTVYKDCKIDLPSVGSIVATLQTVRFLDEVLDYDHESRVVGCRFVDLPNPMEMTLQNYISSLERMLNAKRRGFDLARA